jgi:hypothetical protein
MRIEQLTRRLGIPRELDVVASDVGHQIPGERFTHLVDSGVAAPGNNSRSSATG